MSSADVRHCPRCELRFGSRPELVDHLVAEHGFDQGTVEPFHYRPADATSSDAGGPGRRCLVVANQTIGGPDLREAIRARIDEGTSRFLVLVPATSSRDQARHTGGSEAEPGDARPTPSPEVAPSDEQGVALASKRLDAVLDALRDEGCDAHGEVGPADPESAVHDLLRREHVDEILVATLPPGISRWLNVDLPGRLRRQYHLPVTTVVTRTPSITRR